MDRKILFALDIGTRSVVGIVGEQTAGGISLLAAERQEHQTRAMLDGQIHDVPEVAQILADVTGRLTAKVGPLKKVSVAAAGRALCTVRAETELDCSGRGPLTPDDERTMELAGIQTAQQQLATAKAADDPTVYYCVGYSVTRFTLDDLVYKSLVGQRGKTARLEIIATFLPRQVIDSLQTAIDSIGLEIATLTLEPIAAINVLIPPTMRHLNLALVDVGAGTSDVALTRSGTIIGYGMVPLAGDEITEAISHPYLLDFKVAEKLKRQLGGKNKKVTFTDVLGVTHKLSTAEITETVLPMVGELAQAIAAQILSLNGQPPQAVLLVGGGSLTPRLPEAVANALDIPVSRVAIRCPDSIEGISRIPAMLCAPDGVTPLGILKLAGGCTLNFMQVIFNEKPLRLFNLGKLTVADALLVAGVEARSLTGRPGLGMTVTINNDKKFLPGSMGQPGSILVNGEPASYNSPLAEGDKITVLKGTDGESPCPRLRDLVTVPAPVTVTINSHLFTLNPILTVNGQAAEPDTLLADRDQAVCRGAATVAEAMELAGRPLEAREYAYTINGVERSFSRFPDLTLNGVKAVPGTAVNNNDIISVLPAATPTVAELLGLEDVQVCTLLFNGAKCVVPRQRFTVKVSGSLAALNDPVPASSFIDYTAQDIQPMLSDVLLAAEFDPRSLPPGRVEILLNGLPAEYTAPVKTGDSVEIKTSRR